MGKGYKKALNENPDEATKKLMTKFQKVCGERDKTAFMRFLEKYKLDIISLNVFSNLISRMIGI